MLVRKISREGSLPRTASPAPRCRRRKREAEQRATNVALRIGAGALVGLTFGPVGALAGAVLGGLAGGSVEVK